MEEKKKEGYIAGFIFIIISGILLLVVFNSNGWDITKQVTILLTVIFGGLGLGSLWKPDTIGEIASQILENMRKNTEEVSQTQERTRGSAQGVANRGGQVTQTIIYNEGKRRKSRK